MRKILIRLSEAFKDTESINTLTELKTLKNINND